MSLKRFLRCLCALSLIWCCGGCSSSFNYAGLGNLQRLAKNQGAQGKYLRLEQSMFERLCRDIEAKRLKEGASRNAILRRYGAPAREQKTGEGPGAGTCLVYHHPTDYFAVPQYYLYLDAQGALTRIANDTRAP
jgi:hypothetical protein